MPLGRLNDADLPVGVDSIRGSLVALLGFLAVISVGNVIATITKQRVVKRILASIALAALAAARAPTVGARLALTRTLALTLTVA